MRRADSAFGAGVIPTSGVGNVLVGVVPTEMVPLQAASRIKAMAMVNQRENFIFNLSFLSNRFAAQDGITDRTLVIKDSLAPARYIRRGQHIHAPQQAQQMTER